MTWTPEDAEIRRNALALFKAWKEAEKNFEDSGEEDEPSLPDEARDRISKANEAYWQKHAELRKAHDAELSAIEAEFRPAGPSVLRAVRDRAEEAYNNAPGDAILTDWKDEPIFCAKSGVVLFETDEYIEDTETGEHFLRAALGLPARPVEDEEVEEAA